MKTERKKYCGKNEKKIRKHISFLTKSKGSLMGSAEVLLMRFVGVGCDIQCGIREGYEKEIREGEYVEALL